MDGDFLKRFTEMLDQKQYLQAIEIAKEYAAEDCSNAFYRECLGLAHWLIGNNAEAEESLVKARNLGGVSNRGLILLLRMSLHAGRRKRSREILRDLLADAQMTLFQLEALASKLGEMKEYSAALQVCQHISHRYPYRADAWYGIGYYQEQLGCDASITVTSFRTAFRLSGCACSRVHLARIYMQLGCHREAYELVRSIPVFQLNRVCWAVSVYRIAVANQDFELANSIRMIWSEVASFPMN